MNDDVLVKYLLGEASATESQAVQEWLTARPENAQYFRQFHLLWEQSKQLEPKLDADPDVAWERLQERIRQQSTTIAAVRVKRVPLRFMRAAAALLILMLGAGIYYFAAERSIEIEASTQAVLYTLPDGSAVTLNRNARLVYPRRFGANERHVRLEGEAFFNISPDKHKPFMIDANNASIRVVGTSFNVKTNPGKTEVIVETGIVRLSGKNASTELHPNEKGTLQGNATPVREQNADALHNYYRTRTFVCRNTSLERLSEVLSEAYDVHIIPASKAIGALPLTATFRQDSLDHILGIVCATLNLQEVRNGNNIILK